MRTSKPGNQVLLLLVICCLLLAGCTSETQPSNEPTETTPHLLSADNVSYPPGFSESGVTDASVALRSHRQALEGTSYVYVTHSGSSRFVVRSSIQSKRMRVENRPGGKGERVVISKYRTESVLARKFDPGEGRDASYSGSQVPGSFEKRHKRGLNGQINEILGRTNASFEKAVQKPDGVFIHYTLSNKEGAKGTAVVRNDGLIVSYRIQNTSIFEKVDSVNGTYNITQPQIQRPDWVSKSLRAARAQEDDSSDDGPVGDADCDDFDTQAEAQDYFESHSGTGDLDADDDGLACESLP